MRSPAWVDFLSHDDRTDVLSALAAGIGFQEPAPADVVTRRSLGIPDDLPVVVLARGPGTTRMIGIVSADESPVREQAARIAERLSRKAPHLLWLLVLAMRGRPEVGVAAWHAGAGPPRISALVVDGRDVLPSDGETLSALAASMHGAVDIDVHAQWVEVLG